MVGFASHLDCLQHDTGPSHPERPARLMAIHRALRLAGLLDTPDPFPDFKIDLLIEKQSQKLLELPSEPASESLPLLCHSPAVVERAKKYSALSAVLDGGDTPTCPASLRAALLSLGGAIACTEAVMSGRVKRAFSCHRPPGHHAESSRSMGFCLFNNIAIAARHAQKQHGIERVAIVDFDVHHGNGTQDIFEDDGTVLFISLHQHPSTCYPYSGYDYEVGDGAGRGTTMNLMVNPGSGDDVYDALFRSRVVPALDKFRPQLLMVSAGFDAHVDDPLASMNLSDDGFAMMTRHLTQAADRLCEGRLVSVLEGGYNLQALARSVVRHVVELGLR
jgi:acetoin utilization deacetylase AcuC-like enzyme